MCAGKVTYPSVNIRMLAQPQSGQIEASGPSLCALHQRLHLGRAERDAFQLHQQPGGFGAGECVGCPDLRHRSARPHPGKPHRRVDAGDRNESRVPRKPLDQMVDVEITSRSVIR
jgi:hypothetical protein